MTETELADEIIRQALQLQRLSAGDEQRAIEIMASMEADLRALLASGNVSEAKAREINALIRDAEKAISAGYSAIGGVVDTQGIVMMIAAQTADAMAGISADIVRPTPERLASLADDILIDGAPSSAWWAKQSRQVAFDFAREVRNGVLEGATNEQIVSRIVGRGDEPGILNTARRNVRGLVHSSIMTAANRARLETFRKNSRFTKGVRWLATLDSHTCITCMSLDRKSWDFDGKPIGDHKMQFQMAPAHVNCRCVMSVVPKGTGIASVDKAIEETEMRASKDGPIANTDFAGFLSRQSPEFVRDVLGVKRAELWQAGKITLTDLVSGSGRPLTLEQIAR